MASQVFALIVGIDKYQSGSIWNLNAAVDDAVSIERWLTTDLRVPRDHICTLLDSQATKRNIEERFTSHLLNNSAIEPGDAIIVFFAGHGSSIRAPPGWYMRGRGTVSVLCTYDYDTKLPKGQTNTGISDRSLRAMLNDLARVKGDNITLILDTCFGLPSTNDDDSKERRYTRFAPTRKAIPEDLLVGLWRTAAPHQAEPAGNRGFTAVTGNSHVVLAACPAGCAATERKDGGNFTRALLALKDARPIHKLTYSDLISELLPYMGDHQHAACAGANIDRILFDGVPFAHDSRYVAAKAHDREHMRVDVGAVQGISVGTEFAVHSHNCKGSLNPLLGTYVATLVFPTWCLARPKTPRKQVHRDGWARVTRGSGPGPFRTDVKKSLFTFFGRSRVVDNVPRRPLSGLTEKNGASVTQTEDVKSVEIVMQQSDELTSADGHRNLDIPAPDLRADLAATETAAQFSARLYRKGPFMAKGSRKLTTAKKPLARLGLPSTTTRMSGLGRNLRPWSRVVTTYPWAPAEMMLPPAPIQAESVAW